jgi:hypothetical protein
VWAGSNTLNRRRLAAPRMLSAPQKTYFDSNEGGVYLVSHHQPIARRGLMMHPSIQHDEHGATVFIVSPPLRRRPGKTQAWRPPVWWTTFFVSSLLAATMLTMLTATAAEAKKCKTLRLPSGERFASCGRVPRVISPHGDVYVDRGWVIGGDRYSQRKGSGY